PAAPTASTGRVTTHLPAELVSEQVRRISIFSAVVGAIWAYAVLLDSLIVQIFLPPFAALGVPRRALPIEIGAILLSIATWIFLRGSRATDHAKTIIGLGFMIANAAAIALLNNWIAPPLPIPSIYVSWITNLILVFSMIAPTTPWMLPATL